MSKNLIEFSNNLYNYFRYLFGEESANKYINFIQNKPAQYLRINSLKTTKNKLIKKLKEYYKIQTESLPDFPYSLKVLDNKNLAGKTVEHIIGDYYIQGLSSMIPPMILNPAKDDVVLDLCSAPGSKTTGLAELMENRGTLIANEIALDRIKVLVYNLDRMNIVNAAVLHNKGELLSKIFFEHFDKILVDAPCSGLGIIQKKEEVSKWWSIDRAERLGNLQLRLLIAAIKMLKVGGEVVYSTCTLTVEENEFIIDKVLKKYPIEIENIELPIKSHDGFTSYKNIRLNPQINKARRILPWEADSDGFFIIKLRKTNKTNSSELIKLKRGDLTLLSYNNKEVRNLLSNIENDFGISGSVLSKYKYLIKKNNVYFIANDWEDQNFSIFERIGTRFGVIDKKGGITLHTQAAQVLQNFITENIYEIVDRNELKTYLEGGVIKNHFSGNGQCAIKYNDSILGAAVVTDRGIKSRFPRSKRTQEIVTC